MEFAAWFLIVAGSAAVVLGVVVARALPAYRLLWDRSGRELSRGLKDGGRPFDSSIFQNPEIQEGFQELRDLDPTAAAATRDFMERFSELEASGADPFADARRFFRFLNLATTGTAVLMLVGTVAIVLGVVWLRSI